MRQHEASQHQFRSPHPPPTRVSSSPYRPPTSVSSSLHRHREAGRPKLRGTIFVVRTVLSITVIREGDSPNTAAPFS